MEPESLKDAKLKTWICVSPSCEYIWDAPEKPETCPMCGFWHTAELIPGPKHAPYWMTG